jgi:hypothetical protein
MEISTISRYDIATLKAQWATVYVERFKCTEQLNNIKNRPYTTSEQRSAAIQKHLEIKRCNVTRDKPFVTIDNVTYYRCCCQYSNPRFHLYLAMFSLYQKGVLPFPGSLIEQPAYIVEIMSLFSEQQQKAEEAEHKKLEKKQKMQNNKGNRNNGRQ